MGYATYACQYVARAGVNGPDVMNVSGFTDVDGSGNVVAVASTEYLECHSSGGSTCALVDRCHASFQLAGPGFQYNSSQAATSVQLSRSGQYAWIVQGWCLAGGQPPTPLLNGLYAASSLKLLAPLGRGVLASSRTGRRAVTDRGQALMLDGPQLEWLDATGTHPIRNVNGAFEAVADQLGANVVYVEAAYGRLHWITGPDWTAMRDQDLGFSGSAPALTDDGSKLLFLDAGGSLQLYDGATGALRRLGTDTYSSFATGGSAAFGATTDGRLIRVDLASGDSSVWLTATPEITSVDAPFVYVNLCTDIICYGDTWYASLVSPSMLVGVEGKLLGGGWRARIGGFETPVVPVSDTSAWFQIPIEVTAGGSPEIYNPAFPISIALPLDIVARSITCFSTLHQDFSRPVTPKDPAHPGEVVHLFMTGLQGAETVADGVANPTDHLIAVANPPKLVDPGSMDTLFFGLAPGLVGIQQMDALVHYTGSALFAPSPYYAGNNTWPATFNCSPPVVAAQ
jgi:uncharacterized protein (TIGR03437 family)